MADAQLLETRRKELKVSKTRLAKALHVTRPTLYKILKSPQRATFSQTQVFAHELLLTSQETEQIFLE